MYTIIATKSIKKYLYENLNSFQINSTSKYVTNRYKAITKTKETFDINVYTTGIVTINGTLKDRIYKTLLENSGELDFCGYDEVGVGDFFGPTVYVSVTLNNESLTLLMNTPVNIKDSKKLTDEQILETYEKIKDIDYNSQIVFDKDINNLNSVAQKSYYHYLNINNNAKTHVVDLFTTENAFYKYEKQLNIKYPDNLLLETKADSKYNCVALASIIARALFIKEMDKLDEKYDFSFPYGANIKSTAQEFVKLYSKEELQKFCKTSFKTFDEL